MPAGRKSSAPSRLRDDFDVSRLPPLPGSFYDRDPRVVAVELLGKVLVRRRGRRLLAGRIVENEAYLGAGDPAAHSAAGRTRRNFVLWGPPGRAYVYFIYGNHYCVNVSCLAEGEAGCVLLRALEPLAGLGQMARNRGLDLATLRTPAQLGSLTSGPGRLCEALDITRPADNDADLTDASSGLYITDDGFRPASVTATARVGITKAASEPWRYLVSGSRFVSGRG